MNPLPAPRPSPAGRGRNVRRAVKDQARLMVRNEFDCCSLSHRERVRVRGNHRNSDLGYPTNPGTVIDRREFLWRFGGGLGGIALAHLLGHDELLADTLPSPHAASHAGLHHPAKARRVVQLFMSGAASQCDTFDYKPQLSKHSGEKFDPGEKVEL